MPKPRPPYVLREKSRTGEPVWYVRIGAGPRVRLRAAYGSPEWLSEYNAALRSLETRGPDAKGDQLSLRWLWQAYHSSADWQRLGLSTRRARENIMKHVLNSAGNMHFVDVTRGTIKKGYDERAAKPAAARVFVITMRGMFRWAVEAEHIGSDPSKDVRAPAPPTDGHHTWTAEEVATFERKWPVGTRERLAFDLLLYTGLRRGDASRLGRQHIRGNIFLLRTEKTGEHVEIAIHPALRRSIDASKCGDLTFIATDGRLPMTKESFGNWFGEVCRDTGVPGRAHGLRKALAAKLAERGATHAELDAAFAWRGAGMATLYTRKADRSRLSAQAHARLIENEDKTDQPRAGNGTSGASRK